MKKLIFLALLTIFNCSEYVAEKPNKYEIFQYGIKIDTLCTHRYIANSFVEQGVYFKYIGKCEE